VIIRALLTLKSDKMRTACRTLFYLLLISSTAAIFAGVPALWVLPGAGLCLSLMAYYGWIETKMK